MSEATMSKIKFKPTHEQELAMNHFGSDLLISAGAGSGKTATLTDRIVKRICELGMDISRMLVVTYTKDAANELKVRIAKKLSEKLRLDPKNQHISSQIIKVTSADISTIHSFCLKCLKPNFDKLEIDSDFRIGEESELQILRQDAMNEVIDSFFEAEEIDKDFLIVSNCYSDYTNEDSLPSSLLSLYNNLISTSSGLKLLLEPISSEGDFLQTKYGDVLVKKLKRLVNHFLPIFEELIEEIKSDDMAAKKYLNTYADFYDKLLRLQNALVTPSFDTVADIFKDFKAVPFAGGRKIPAIDTELIIAVRDEIKEEFESLRDNFFSVDKDAVKSSLMQNERNCHAIYKVLKEFDSCYKAKKRKHSLCDFNDLERYTLELFYNSDGEISPYAKEISLKYDELYIDEYQDNNSVQDRIFYAISRNNRFMVGDIKQSIYGFRSAEPELFSHYRDSFVPYGEECTHGQGRTIFMSDNFRCDPDVIKTANAVSDYMFLNSSGFKYVDGDRLKPSKIHEGEFKPQATDLCLIDKSLIEKDSYFDNNSAQAEFVAQEIRDLLDNGYLPNGEKIMPKHIAILLKSKRGHIDKYIETLNKYGIKHEYSQDIKFFEKPHILLMLCLLNSIDNPSKDVYLAGALHSDIWHFSLDELVEIRKSSPKEYSLFSALNNYSGNEKLEHKVKDFLEKLRFYRSQIRKMSAESAISFAINESGFMSLCNKTEREDIIKLYNMARNYEQGSYKGLYSFLRYIDDTSKSKTKETVTSDPHNSVRIITMHASKGLEYEICFLCDTETQFSRKGYSSPLLFDKKLGVCGYVGLENGIVKYDNLVRKCAALSIKEAELEEAMRLLYVAMTRARSKLYIVASLSKPQTHIDSARLMKKYNDEYTVYSKKNHISFILGACPYPVDFINERRIDPNDLLLDKELSPDEELSQVEKINELAKVLKSRFDFEYEYEKLEKIPSKLSISRLYPEILDDEENNFANQTQSIESIPDFVAEKKSLISAAEKGTATHVFLQFCDFDKLVENGTDKELERLVTNSFISPSVAEIINLDHIEIFRSSQLMQDFLNAKKIIREFRFNIMLDAEEFSNDERLKDEKVLVQGVTDCIYENEKGELILVDYKTDQVTPENYIEKLRKSHYTQLTYYKKAVEMMFERPVSKVLIYSVPLGKTVEII